MNLKAKYIGRNIEKRGKLIKPAEEGFFTSKEAEYEPNIVIISREEEITILDFVALTAPFETGFYAICFDKAGGIHGIDIGDLQII